MNFSSEIIAELFDTEIEVSYILLDVEKKNFSLSKHFNDPTIHPHQGFFRVEDSNNKYGRPYHIHHIATVCLALLFLHTTKELHIRICDVRACLYGGELPG